MSAFEFCVPLSPKNPKTSRFEKFQEQPGETSNIIVDYLKQELKKNELMSKIVAFCGENTN